MNLIERLTKVFQTVFHDESIVLDPAMTSDDVDEWDSFSHINLIIAIELEFDITFIQNEALTFENVGELIQYIEDKVSTP
ncbi:MAG: acyl carrier protein [Anaerolineaceae bacterium]|nr:acyl carrier protein [Anaerolineaceae bacterium]